MYSKKSTSIEKPIDFTSNNKYIVGNMIVDGFLRNDDFKIGINIRDIVDIIVKYYTYNIKGIWNYTYSKVGHHCYDWDYNIEIFEDFTFTICLSYTWHDRNYYSNIDYEMNLSRGAQSIKLNGFMQFIDHVTYLLFFDKNSSEQLQNKSNTKRNEIMNILIISQRLRDDIYIKRILDIYKKNKITKKLIKKKFDLQIKELKLLNVKNKSNKKKKKFKNKKIKIINWKHVEMKFKEISLKKIKGNTPFHTKRLKKQYLENYVPSDHQIIYEKICKKYKEKPLPVYLGPIYLKFKGKNRKHCMLCYQQKEILKRWIKKQSES